MDSNFIETGLPAPETSGSIVKFMNLFILLSKRVYRVAAVEAKFGVLRENSAVDHMDGK